MEKELFLDNIIILEGYPKKLQLPIEGYLEPINILWAIGFISNTEYILWKVEGFSEWYRLSNYDLELYAINNLEEHIKEVLKNLRKIIIEWLPYEKKPKWVLEYLELLKNNIVLI